MSADNCGVQCPLTEEEIIRYTDIRNLQQNSGTQGKNTMFLIAYLSDALADSHGGRFLQGRRKFLTRINEL
ncbi:MAG: hypothetical protein DDT19_02744 [Syntrophomonadaceae bacterium]|nr:hypothetical protein [Bacillota bacterium]